MPKRKEDKRRWKVKFKTKEQGTAEEFPEALRTPEFDPTPWNSDGIRIGGEAGWLDVNFCYNTLCSNYGKTSGKNTRYKVRKKGYSLEFICKECGLERKIYSNEAVEAMFLYVLKNNLLHDYCPNEACDNYRVNMYEHMYDRKHENHRNGYGVASVVDSCARCKKCGKRFAVGATWRLHEGKRLAPAPVEDEEDVETEKKPVYPADIQRFMMDVYSNTGPSAMMFKINCYAEHYYKHLHSLADTCNFVSSRHLMELQSNQFAESNHYKENNGCIQLYSDVMQISIFMGGEAKRTEQLLCLLTTATYNESYFVLAFTPMFVPEKFTKEEKIENNTQLGFFESHQSNIHLQWEGAPTNTDTSPSSRLNSFPVMGLGGYPVRSSYGAIAHFLVLRKMLSRFKRIIHYIDNEREMKTAALLAFSDKIKAGECEVVSVSIVQAMKSKAARPQRQKNINKFKEKHVDEEQSTHDGRPEKRLPSGERLRAKRKNELKESVAELEPRLADAAQAYSEKRDETTARQYQYPNERAYVYRLAVNKMTPERVGADDEGEGENEGENEGEGEGENEDSIKLNLWVQDPLPPSFEAGRVFLRITRRPEETGESCLDQEAELYLDAKHQPADTYMSSLRRGASTAERPHLIASTRSGAGYLSSSRKPIHAIAEFVLHTFGWNFMRRKRGSSGQYNNRASELGLTLPGPLNVKKSPNIRKQVFAWAKEITEWLGT